MTDEPDNLMLVSLRRLDANVAALRQDVTDLEQRFTTLAVQVSPFAATEASHYAQTALRLDRMTSASYASSATPTSCLPERR